MTAAAIFAEDIGSQYADYRVQIQVRELLIGGVPSDPSVIRKWLETRLGLGDAALDELLSATVAERNGPMSAEEKVDAIMASDGAPSITGFKRDVITGELVYEGRCMKSALKESMNSSFPGTDWPGKKDRAETKPLRKGLMRYAAEAVHVDDYSIGLGVKEPTRVEEHIKHPMTPTGPISTISRVEVVERPTLTFTVKVRDDFLPRAAWGRIWQTAEEIGIGAERSQGYGKFDLVEFDRM